MKRSARGPLALASAALAVATITLLALPDTEMQRMAELDFSKSGLPQTYLMFSRDRPDRCRVLDRRGSTMRRDDARERHDAVADFIFVDLSDGQA